MHNMKRTLCIKDNIEPFPPNYRHRQLDNYFKKGFIITSGSNVNLETLYKCKAVSLHIFKHVAKLNLCQVLFMFLL